jgi:hypothetical protein
MADSTNSVWPTGRPSVAFLRALEQQTHTNS